MLGIKINIAFIGLYNYFFSMLCLMCTFTVQVLNRCLRKKTYSFSILSGSTTKVILLVVQKIIFIKQPNLFK